MAVQEISHSDEVERREWEQHQASLREQEKKDAIVTVNEGRPSDDDEAALIQDHWHTGWRQRFPWVGACALLTMVICMGFVVLILVTSDGKAKEEWPSKTLLFTKVLLLTLLQHT
jgi:hypothetical protein